MAEAIPAPVSLSGLVLDSTGNPMANVGVTLIGGSGPQVQLTDSAGSFTFTNLFPGDYKVLAVHNQSNGMVQKLVALQWGKALPDLTLQMPPSGEVIAKQNNPYLALKYYQYIFLGVIGLLFFWYLIANKTSGLSLADLKDPETARGIITYLVAVTTVAMGAILMFTAIMTGGKDLDKRFTLGKEIFTLLIGVLGTIIGFYYGTSTNPRAENTAVGGSITSNVTIQEVKINPQFPEPGKPFLFNTNLTGGTRPYTYSISFVPENVGTPLSSSVSCDGRINQIFQADSTLIEGTIIRYIINVKDNDGMVSSTSGQFKLKG